MSRRLTGECKMFEEIRRTGFLTLLLCLGVTGAAWGQEEAEAVVSPEASEAVEAVEEAAATEVEAVAEAAADIADAPLIAIETYDQVGEQLQQFIGLQAKRPVTRTAVVDAFEAEGLVEKQPTGSKRGDQIRRKVPIEEIADHDEIETLEDRRLSQHVAHASLDAKILFLREGFESLDRDL